MADLTALRKLVQAAEDHSAAAPNDPLRLRKLADALSVLGFEAGFDRSLHDESRSLMDKAIAIYRRVLAMTPDDGVALTNLGAALSDSGRHKSALQVLRRAVVQLPDDRNAHFNLGVALLNTLGKGAREQFRKAAELRSTETREAFFDPHGY